LRESIGHEKTNCTERLILLWNDSYVRVTKALPKNCETGLEISAAEILHALDELELALV